MEWRNKTGDKSGNLLQNMYKNKESTKFINNKSNGRFSSDSKKESSESNNTLKSTKFTNIKSEGRFSSNSEDVSVETFDNKETSGRRFDRKEGSDRNFFSNSESTKFTNIKSEGRFPSNSETSSGERFDNRNGSHGRFNRKEGSHGRFDKREGSHGRFDKREGSHGRFDNRDGSRRRFDNRDGSRRRFDNRDGSRRRDNNKTTPNHYFKSYEDVDKILNSGKYIPSNKRTKLESIRKKLKDQYDKEHPDFSSTELFPSLSLNESTSEKTSSCWGTKLPEKIFDTSVQFNRRKISSNSTPQQTQVNSEISDDHQYDSFDDDDDYYNDYDDYNDDDDDYYNNGGF